MIGRLNRFHGYNSLNFVYRHGKTVRGPQLALKYSENPRRKIYRAAVVVGRKVHKSAVVRNRIRRRIYEAIRLHDNLINGPYDLVFTVFSDQLAAVSPNEVRHLVEDLLKRAHLDGNQSNDRISQDTNHDIVKPKD